MPTMNSWELQDSVEITRVLYEICMNTEVSDYVRNAIVGLSNAAAQIRCHFHYLGGNIHSNVNLGTLCCYVPCTSLQIP